jgi:serine-type D-Ala-D-Ala endopeptidase (penicillin-binding protein 7)
MKISRHIKKLACLAASAILLMAGPAAGASAKRHGAHGVHTKAVAKSPRGDKAGTKTAKGGRHVTGSRPVAALRHASLHGARASVVRVVAEPPKPSFGQAYGLHDTEDPLELKSSVAFVMDQDTNEVLLSKNSTAVLPIASITKLMTGVIVTEAKQPLDEVLDISEEDVDTEKGSRSRLVVGTQLTRGEMLHLALMSSENRAAHTLGRHYPGGLAAFVTAMNAKARALGMNDTRYVEPTGLSSQNQSSARDLATLVKWAYNVPLLRELTTSPEYEVAVGHRQVQFHTTNRLVKSPEWDMGLKKTGFINEAGQCLVMQARLAGRKLILVLLDSAGKYSRIGDAERIRHWLLGAQSPLSSVHPLQAGRTIG